MRALITGHMGFIGRHFTQYLLDKDYMVVGIDIKQGHDCRDYFKDSDEQFNFIVHCAAIVGGRENIENDPLGVATDLSIDAEFFNWCIRTKQTCPIIYFSSSAAYPIEYQREPNHRLNEFDIDWVNIKLPDMTYGWSKLTGEYLADIAKMQYGLRVYVFRPFSGYGQDQDLTYPFPAIIERAKKGENPFVIWGTGNQCRDFIHVDDIIQGVMAVVSADYLHPINLCSGYATSFKDLAKVVTKVMGYSPKIICDNTKPEGVKYRVGDPTRFHKIYQPKITLVEGIKLAMEEL